MWQRAIVPAQSLEHEPLGIAAEGGSIQILQSYYNLLP